MSSIWSSVKHQLVFAALSACLLGTAVPTQAAVAQKPPMGWNSYDAFNFSVTEAEFKANVDSIAKKYLQYGWEYAIVDWSWSYPGMSTTGTPNQGWTPTGGVTTHIKIDAYGRPQPDSIRHPSSVGGLGFKPLADYAHSKGLKFGIHLMRGMYREAYWKNTPVLGTSYHARDITDTTNVCPWLDHTYGLNMNHPGAQAYLNSLFTMFASWGVDFIKIDDMVQNRVTPFAFHSAELAGYRKAIDSSGREMVFSSSPGATPLNSAAAILPVLNQWRMADDLWDNWTTLSAMIDLARQWYPYIGAGHFPDADMIPIGRVSKRGPNGSSRYSSLTPVEQHTMMSMWAMCRSPLMWGGNPAENRPAEDSLMTNTTVIAINQSSSRNRYIGSNTNLAVWAADSPIPQVKYFAFFNRTSNAATMSISLDSLGAISGTPIDVWTGASNDAVTGTFSAVIPSHGSGLYRFIISQAVAVRPGPVSATPLPTGVSPFGIYEIRGRKVDPSKDNAAGVYIRGGGEKR